MKRFLESPRWRLVIVLPLLGVAVGVLWWRGPNWGTVAG